jgi:hypothetical protein
MMCVHARELIAASWQGDLDPASEANLKHHLAACAECSAEMSQLGSIWEKLGDIPVPEPSHALRVRWESTLESLIGSQPSPKPSRTWSFANLWPRNPAWQGAIAMACLLIGLLIGNSTPRHDKEIAKLHEEIASTREMVALSLLQQQSATARLKGVDYSGRMPTLEPEVVSALVQAVDHDPSVNVRLAAIDALGKASGSAGVRNALARSLPQQDSPMVQAALVDYFMDAHDRQAVGVIRQLSQQPDINPAVLERTHTALKELSQ